MLKSYQTEPLQTQNELKAEEKAMLRLIIALVFVSSWAHAECVAPKGTTLGTAEYVGDPWVHQWEIGGTIRVPGEDLIATFGDEVITYDAGETADARADNLGSVAEYVMDRDGGPYPALLYDHGAVVVLHDDCTWAFHLRQPHPTNPTTTGQVADEALLECLILFRVEEYDLLDGGEALGRDVWGRNQTIAAFAGGACSSH